MGTFPLWLHRLNWVGWRQYCLPFGSKLIWNFVRWPLEKNVFGSQKDKTGFFLDKSVSFFCDSKTFGVSFLSSSKYYHRLFLKFKDSTKNLTKDYFSFTIFLNWYGSQWEIGFRKVILINQFFFSLDNIWGHNKAISPKKFEIAPQNPKLS